MILTLPTIQVHTPKSVLLGHVDENAAPGIVQLLRQYGILFNFCLENRFYDAEFGIWGTILF